jgi:hypothetical protein
MRSLLVGCPFSVIVRHALIFALNDVDGMVWFAMIWSFFHLFAACIPSSLFAAYLLSRRPACSLPERRYIQWLALASLLSAAAFAAMGLRVFFGEAGKRSERTALVCPGFRFNAALS